MNINIQGFLETLPYMAKGLAGIFLVTLVIMLSITILNKLTKPKE